MRAVLCWALVGFAMSAHAADPLALTIRPQLPPQVRTVAEAAAYYLEPAGYAFHARTPLGGDARRIVHQPVRTIPIDAGVMSIQTALLAVVPADVYVIVDHEHKAVAYSCARCPGATSAASMPASRVDVASLFEVPTKAPIEDVVKLEPSEAFPRSVANAEATKPTGASAAPERSEAIATRVVKEAPATEAEFEVTQVGPASIAAIGPAAAVFGPVEPVKPKTPTYTYELVSGETLEQGLARWGKREGFLVLYRAEFQLPVIQNTTVPAESLSEAVTYVLGLLAGTPHALVADEAPNHVLVIRTP